MSFSGALAIALPELILAIGAMALLVTGAFKGDRSTALVSSGAGLVLVVAAAAACWGPMGAAFSGGFVADQASAFAKVAIYLMSAVAVVLGDRWLHRIKAARFEFPVLIMLAALGMGVMVSAGDLISLYLGVELMSLATYVLAAFQRDDAKSSEAGLKYFVLGALSSGLLLYGASLIYGFAGSTRFPEIAAAVHAGAGQGVIFGVVFLICGLAFKVAAAPFHMWTPDVYEGAPTPVVAFFSAAPKLAALVLFARALLQGFPGATEQWSQVIVAIAVISMAVGALAGLVQKNLKRLLAYSSIANIGYALLALAAGTQAGVQAMLVFMILYMIDVTGFFACLIALSRKGEAMDTLPSLAGLAKEKPGLALCLTGLSFSVMGIPPFSGFWAKYYVFKAAIAAGLWPAAVFGLVASVVAAFYYLRMVKTMWFDPSPGETDPAPMDARTIAAAAALFSFPLVLPALAALDPLAKLAASAFHIV
ncbi:MAG TPA: NADH-quinone oxidoreductase subunit NuoN [Caulobacteraceae bacterium]|jgi:NADH-quinone oxidoreductase subunit N|nr:NADH-quinone oxidoreductase subunit NuoN [Caulobacteraceae bacterium]